MKVLRKEDLKRIGFVNKAVGFKGELNCVTDIARPEKLLKSKFLFLIIEGLPVPFAIEDIEVYGSELSVKFEEVNSEIEAKKLLRKEIYAEKFREKKSNDDLLNWKDLQGYTAIEKSHGVIGVITEVFEHPQQMIARCMVGEKEVLFPLNDDIVTEINEDEKKVFVELADGLLDIYLK